MGPRRRRQARDPGVSEGRLVVVATPIGNLGDLSPRAVEALASADVICCEDTRRSGRLLAAAGVRPRRLLSLHAHNEAARTAEVLTLLERGLEVALVTDAGTPAISDPGGRVVSAVHEAGGRVTAVPGPSAAVTALALSGLGGGRWRFEGFLPRRGRERRQRLEEIAGSPVPVVIYEAPTRLASLIADLARKARGERLVAVCRELTKLHEEVWRGTLAEAAERWGEPVRGELVVVLDGDPAAGLSQVDDGDLVEAVEALTRAGASRRDAVQEVAERTGVARRRVYEATGARPPGGGPRAGL